jgi:formyltetrahydrofolate deformylase
LRQTAKLLVSCNDRKGLVARISDFIYRNGGNILDFDHHTDLEAGVFLARIEWELKDFQIPAPQIAAAFSNLASECQIRYQVFLSDHVPKIAIFASKLPHCLVDLLLRHQAGDFKAEITLILSNHEDVSEIARSFGLPFKHFPIWPENKGRQEQAQIQEMIQRKVELIVLARYMQILSERFVSTFPNRIINIHHSFLPAFIGAAPYHQAFARGVKLIGATGHYVTTALDDGPIIEQETTRVSHRDSLEDMIRKGRDLEKSVLARSVRLHLLRKVLTYGNKTVVFD